MSRTFVGIVVLMSSLVVAASAQLRRYEIHNRGMLHETVFNTGEIGRAWHQGQAGNETNVPLMEWPGNSRTIVDGVEYDGHHNLIGAGVYIGATIEGDPARKYSYSGGVGSGSTEIVAGVWVFPQSIVRRENFPVLPSGVLNPSYNPDEAEEIIIAKWGTNIGLTITRTSRAWSFPDYDDMIIYEYEIENTGNQDGNPATIESNATLYDVLIGFGYGFAPSMFGFQRTYNRWLYTDYESKDQRGRFDRDRWLKYVMDITGKPDPKYYDEWGRTGKNGGGLTAPQAVGFMTLYYDTQHLATYSETTYRPSSSDSVLVWDANGRIRQPWTNRQETSNTRSSKIQTHLDIDPRRNNPYRNLTVYGEDWLGRGNYNVRQSFWGTGQIMYFGPYTLRHGDKIRFALAEVAGYGAARKEETDAWVLNEGGSCGQLCGEVADSAFYPVTNWSQPIKYGPYSTGTSYTFGSTYLSNYNLPDYVNSNVVTMREVADKAKEAYSGSAAPPPYWPETFPERGVYQVPIPVPAPAIVVQNSATAQNEIIWGNQVESFSHPRLIAPLNHYEVLKAEHPLGPWLRVDSVAVADTRYFAGTEYQIRDLETRVGESFYYSVVTVDENGNKSGRTNMTLHKTQLAGHDLDEPLQEVTVVPNPFIVESQFGGAGETSSRIGFYNLPKKCTIRIYSYSGQLVQTIEHDTEQYEVAWLQVTRNNQLIASGLYFFIVERLDGVTTTGKFVVIR
ncbi:MAG: T9SS type A sorting domain-containing protein [Bacteroidota bacterium]